MDDSVLKTLRDKYFLRDDNGQLIETEPTQMYSRVAKAVASVEETEELQEYWEKEFYTLMEENIFLPNSPTLMNAGTHIKSLAACFVVDIEDSREGIHRSLGDGMEIFASGGGVGFPFSKLRARGDLVKSTRGKASGPVSFAFMYDAMCGTIMQGGKRRGAAMGTLRVDHPDVMEFIDIKRDKNNLNNFNFSVLLTNEFMEALADDKMFWARDPKTGEQRAFNWEGAEVGIAPQIIMDRLIDSAWGNGEPGVYFIDNADMAHPFPSNDKEMAVMGPNPCGEAVLRAYESCVLGSINLTKFVKGPNKIDVDALAKAAYKAVRFLDNVISYSEPPLKRIEQETKYTRKIGLGVMGLHDALLMMELPYSLSKSAGLTRDMVSSIFSTLSTAAKMATIQLAKEKGEFPAYNRSNYAKVGHSYQNRRRNASLMSIAPTGTIARICDVSFGIEPNQFWQTDHNLTEVQYQTVHKLAAPYFEKGEHLPEYFESALEISPQDHLDMQILVQQYVDQAVSKTVLLPNSASKEDIAPLFMKAWRGGLKGFTVYRDGSRADQPISATKSVEELYEAPKKSSDMAEVRERTTIMYGPSYKVKTPEGNVYVDIHNNTNDEVCEIMLQLSDGFTDTEKSLANWVARVLSKGLQFGIPYEEIVKQGASTEFEHKSRAYPGRVFWFGTNGKQRAYRSIPEVVSDLIIQQVNKLAIGDDDEDIAEILRGTDPGPIDRPRCPLCHGTLALAEGCYSCACGYSKCT